MENIYFYTVLFVMQMDFSTAQGVNIRNGTVSAYNMGVNMGIINPDKYSLDSFQRDEEYIFRDTYQEYISLNISDNPVDYEEWLLLNNFGILPDSQESLFEPKPITRSRMSKNKREFLATVRQGDILITEKRDGPFHAHAAIMTTNYWVLDMAGGKRWEEGIPSNNRQMPKDQWYDLFEDKWTTIYRFDRYQNEARQAAVWADQNYFNPVGGGDKMIHVTCQVTYDFKSLNPSYPGKLVVHAYYYATDLVDEYAIKRGPIILAMNIRDYFREPKRLKNKGRY